jgi:nitroreductase
VRCILEQNSPLKGWCHGADLPVSIDLKVSKRISMMNAIDALRTRRSIRTYEAKPVEQRIIEEIVDCARLAPTAMNAQPWDFVVITAKEDLVRIPPMLGHAEFIANAAFAVLVLGRETDCTVEDCSAATENLLLAATAHGIGSCWVAGIGQPYAPTVVKEFGAPEDRRLIAIVSFGYAAEDPQIEKRALADVLHWNRF